MNICYNKYGDYTLGAPMAESSNEEFIDNQNAVSVIFGDNTGAKERFDRIIQTTFADASQELIKRHLDNMISNAKKNGFIVSSNNKITQEDIADIGLDKLLGSDRFTVDKKVYYDFFGVLKDKINKTSSFNYGSDPIYKSMERASVYVNGMNDKEHIGKLINMFAHGYEQKMLNELRDGKGDFNARRVSQECSQYLKHNLRLLAGLDSYLVTANTVSFADIKGRRGLSKLTVACIPSRKTVISALSGQRLRISRNYDEFANVKAYGTNNEIRAKMLHGLSKLRDNKNDKINNLKYYKKNAKQRLKDEEEKFVLYEKLPAGDRDYMDALYSEYDSLISQKNRDVDEIAEVRRKIRIAEKKLFSSKKEIKRQKKLNRLSREHRIVLEKLYSDSDYSLNGLTEFGTKYKNYIRMVEDAMLSGEFDKLGLKGVQSKALSFADWDRQAGIVDIENSYGSLIHNLANTKINIDNIDYEKIDHYDKRQQTNFTKDEQNIIDNLHNKKFAKSLLKNPVKGIKRSINNQFKDGFQYYVKRIIKPTQYIQDHEEMRKERAPEQQKVEELFSTYGNKIQEDEGMTM